MSSFILPDLEPLLLENIINKLEKRSYIRLQRTCHLMYDFIRNFKHISVRMTGFYSLALENDTPFIHSTGYPYIKRNFDGFYGARISNLTIEEGFDFETICDSIKKNRLTCNDLHFSRDYWSKEQILTFLKVVKPMEVSLYSEGSDRYEALLHFKQLKEVFIYFDPEDISLAIPQLLPVFPSVRIHTRQGSEPEKLLRMVLQLLRSQANPHFHKFHVSVDGELDWSADFVKTEFREFLEDVDGEKIDDEEEEAASSLDENDSIDGDVEDVGEDGYEEEVNWRERNREDSDDDVDEQDEEDVEDEGEVEDREEENEGPQKVIRASLKLPEQYPDDGYAVLRLEASYFLSVLYFGPRF